MRQERLDDAQRAEGVHVQGFDKPIEIHVEGRLRLRADDACIVDENVDRLANLCCGLLDLGLVTDIQHEQPELSIREKLCPLGRDAALVANRADHAIPTMQKNAGELPPDPASDACDEGSPHGNYRENFLYLIRCGIVESVPRRRFLSSS